MIRALLRLTLLIVVLAAVGGYLLGWWSTTPRDGAPSAVGTSGVNTDRARDIGAQVGERTAVAADQARRALTDGQVTAKIKAKMALDDSVKALSVDVDTNGTTVTLSGTVETAAQRDRVLQLARETEGVQNVVDHLRVR